MTAHLGNRVSALIDGQLPAEDADRDWTHVYTCHACRDLVEREGWIKNRLSRLSGNATSGVGPTGAPDALKGALSGLTPRDVSYPMGPVVSHLPHPRRATRVTGLAAIGGSAVGAAVVGILALGAAPADSPITTNISRLRSPQTVSPAPAEYLRPVNAGLRKVN